jgi:hypothetical protein
MDDDYGRRVARGQAYVVAGEEIGGLIVLVGEEGYLLRRGADAQPASRTPC